MANPTGFITNNVDLNTVFAPINNIDYGTFKGNPASTVGPTNPTVIGEGWSTFTEITSDSGTNNVTVIASSSDPPIRNGFTINKSGIYRLSISLRFTTPAAESNQPMVFILNSVNTIPASNGYVFTPYPSLDSIYSFGGLCVAGTGTLTNRNNQVSLANALQTNASGNEYMFSFQLQSGNTNIATFEITFYANFGKTIYPQIRCVQGSTDPQTTLNNGNWVFTKLSK